MLLLCFAREVDDAHDENVA